MAEKKTKKAKKAKSTKEKAKPKQSKQKSTKKKSKKDEPFSDGGIIIVDDDLGVDKEREIEERRAYLEEARSQEASD